MNFIQLFAILQLPLLISSLTLREIERTFLCDRDPQDSSSCTFSGIQDSTQFYRSLVSNEDFSRSSIKQIKFKDTLLTHMPKELTLLYLNVEDLDASSVQLWRFVRIDFASDTKIRKLNVSFNKIHWLTNDMCGGMRNLETLDLSHNMIDLIDRNAFSYNENLKYLNLSYNRIGKISSDFISAIRSVKILNLNNNKISSITGDLSDILLNIDELYLSNNELAKFDPVIAKQASYLDISNNNLEGEITFAGTKLMELYIRGNLLQSLTINYGLKKLDTSDNTERSFELNFGNNMVLTHVSLSNLDIVHYDDILLNLKNLHSLEYLDLSQNNLETFDFKTQLLPTSLKVLNLKRTDLHSMMNWRGLKILLPNIQEINILDNFLSCTELPDMLKSFTESNITVSGLSIGNESKFVEKNCAVETHRKRKPAVNAQGNEQKQGYGNGIISTLLIICIFGYVCGAALYFNKKYYVLEKLMEKVSSRNQRSRFDAQHSNLLDDSA